MTIACKIDGISISETGVVQFDFTNAYPLPAIPSGAGVSLNSKADLIQKVADAEESMKVLLPYLALAPYLKIDPFFQDLERPVGHGIVVDLLGVTQAVQNF